MSFPESNIVSLLFDTWSMIITVYGLCLPELHTMSLLLDISSMTFFFYFYVFQSSIVSHYCLTFHLWSPLLMFMSSRDNITSLMFNVFSMIIAIHACVFQRSNMVPFNVRHITIWSSFIMLVCSRDIYHVPNV